MWASDIRTKTHLTFPELVSPMQRTLIRPDAPRMTCKEGDACKVSTCKTMPWQNQNPTSASEMRRQTRRTTKCWTVAGAITREFVAMTHVFSISAGQKLGIGVWGSWLPPQGGPATKLRAHVPRNRSAPHSAHEGQKGHCGSGLEIQLIIICMRFDCKNLLKFNYYNERLSQDYNTY